ncbi:hypothetical protein J1605_018024, partial [Eschrichtius robustus]
SGSAAEGEASPQTQVSCPQHFPPLTRSEWSAGSGQGAGVAVALLWVPRPHLPLARRTERAGCEQRTPADAKTFQGPKRRPRRSPADKHCGKPLLKTAGMPTISIPKEKFESPNQVLSGLLPPPTFGNGSLAVPALEPVLLPQLSVFTV